MNQRSRQMGFENGWFPYRSQNVIQFISFPEKYFNHQKMLGHNRFIVARLLRKSSLAHLTNTHSHTHSLSLSLSLSLSHTHSHSHTHTRVVFMSLSTIRDFCQMISNRNRTRLKRNSCVSNFEAEPKYSDN